MKKYYVEISCLVFVLLACVFISLRSKPQVETVLEVAERLHKSELYIVVLHKDTTPVAVVSTTLLTAEEAVDYNMRRMLLPNTGKAVIMGVATDHATWNSDWRSWGSVSATGDPALLARLDDLLR